MMSQSKVLFAKCFCMCGSCFGVGRFVKRQTFSFAKRFFYNFTVIIDVHYTKYMNI